MSLDTGYWMLDDNLIVGIEYQVSSIQYQLAGHKELWEETINKKPTTKNRSVSEDVRPKIGAIF